jgi:dienelactone hydrolase
MKVFFTVLILSTVALASNLQIKEIATPFLGSTLYVPNDGKTHTGIIILHGSEGGSLPYFELEAQFLTAHGYATLAFCWYNCRKNPILSPINPLENVELRTTIDAIKWLKNRPEVAGMKVAVYGFSRGAEQAILLGSIDEAILLVDAIGAHSPSDTVVSGLVWGAEDKRCWICSQLDLACFNNSNNYEQWDWKNMRWNPSCGAYPKYPRQMNAWLLDGVPFKIGESIQIEKFKKPVFLTVGDKDEIWDHNKTIRIADRLNKFNLPVELHVFPGERHNFNHIDENQRHEMLLDFLARTLH